MAIILTILGVIIGIAGIAGLCLIASGRMETSFRKFSIVVIAVGFIVAILAQSVVIIPTNHTGVKTTFSQISDKTLNNGLHLKIPFAQSIEIVNNKQQDITAGKDQIWSETVNRTALWYQGITVTYQINPEKSAWIYANISDYKRNLVSEDIVESAVKSASKTQADEDATNRSIIEPLVAENIQKSLNDKYGENVVSIKKVTIKSADFEDAYNEAITQKQNAQIAYEQQQIENKKLIETAEAEANAKIKAAEGEAKANELLRSSISEEVLQSKLLDKWNGELPKAVGGNNTGFMLDVFGQETSSEQTVQ